MIEKLNFNFTDNNVVEMGIIWEDFQRKINELVEAVNYYHTTLSNLPRVEMGAIEKMVAEAVKNEITGGINATNRN